MRYRARPLIANAVLWQPVVPVLSGLGVDEHGVCYAPDGYSVPSPVGPLRIRPGDWLLTASNGQKFPMDPDLFAATYEPVPDPEGAPAS